MARVRLFFLRLWCRVVGHRRPSGTEWRHIQVRYNVSPPVNAVSVACTRCGTWLSTEEVVLRLRDDEEFYVDATESQPARMLTHSIGVVHLAGEKNLWKSWRPDAVEQSWVSVHYKLDN